MSTTIQKPTIGRVVIFTARRGTGEASGKVDEYPGIVVLALHADYGIVDIKIFGPNGMYDNKNVPYDANGAPMTWRYPPHSKDTLDVGESGCVIVKDEVLK